MSAPETVNPEGIESVEKDDRSVVLNAFKALVEIHGTDDAPCHMEARVQANCVYACAWGYRDPFTSTQMDSLKALPRVLDASVDMAMKSTNKKLVGALVVKISTYAAVLQSNYIPEVALLPPTYDPTVHVGPSHPPRGDGVGRVGGGGTQQGVSQAAQPVSTKIGVRFGQVAGDTATPRQGAVTAPSHHGYEEDEDDRNGDERDRGSDGERDTYSQKASAPAAGSARGTSANPRDIVPASRGGIRDVLVLRDGPPHVISHDRARGSPRYHLHHPSGQGSRGDPDDGIDPRDRHKRSRDASGDGEDNLRIVTRLPYDGFSSDEEGDHEGDYDPRTSGRPKRVRSSGGGWWASLGRIVGLT